MLPSYLKRFTRGVVKTQARRSPIRYQHYQHDYYYGWKKRRHSILNHHHHQRQQLFVENSLVCSCYPTWAATYSSLLCPCWWWRVVASSIRSVAKTTQNVTTTMIAYFRVFIYISFLFKLQKHLHQIYSFSSDRRYYATFKSSSVLGFWALTLSLRYSTRENPLYLGLVNGQGIVELFSFNSSVWKVCLKISFSLR